MRRPCRQLFCAVCMCAAFLAAGCAGGDSASEADAVPLSVTVRSRDSALYFAWTEPPSVAFTAIQIECLSVSDSSGGEAGRPFDAVRRHVSAGESSYVLSSLDNGTTYTVLFTAWDSAGTAYSRRLEGTPGVCGAQFDNLSAFIYGGTVHISWAFKPLGDGYEDAAVSFSVRNEGIADCAAAAVPVYEQIGEDVLDETAVYDTYYTCVVSGAAPDEGMEFELRAVNSQGVEIGSASVTAHKLHLPVIELTMDMDGDNVAKFMQKKKLDATLSTYNDGSGGGISAVPLTVKGRGNSSWENAPKKSYTLKFKSEQNLLGMERHTSFALVANYFDKTLLRNVSAYELGRAVFTNMAWNPDAKCAHLFVNGVYVGLYTAVETNKIAENRIGVPNVEDCADPAGFERYGYLLEANQRADEAFNIHTERGVWFSLKEPDGEDVSSEIKERIREKVAAVESALFSDDFGSPDSPNYYGRFLDTDSFIDWLLVEELAKNPDSDFYSSCYMYFNPGEQKFCMGPLWDFDLGFGNIKIDGGPEGLKAAGVPGASLDGSQPYSNWMHRLYEDAGFKAAAAARWREVRPQVEAYFADGSASGFMANYERIKLEAAFNFDRWEILGNPVWKCPDGYKERTTYESEVAYFRTWLASRITWLDSELDGKAVREE